MIKITIKEILELDKIPRLTLINSIVGYKPANLVGTTNSKGQTNLAIISSVVHLGSDPPFIGFIMRPGERHTMENILENGKYTINHIHEKIAEKAHFTSADFPRDISEFDVCGLTSEFIVGFYSPFVAESNIKIGLSMVEKIDININNTVMIVGQIDVIYMKENYLESTFHLDLEAANSICISGLDTYHLTQKMARFPFAQTNNLPIF